ncbi:hypothetical protein EVAR_99237_1 [Eumeta japonica]|uniref:Uncharacterized protein n=1 Tax=Eumeta variegata TaxID=151549 RepID=A0A4C2AFK8_EUMVA|nr:hypothetical protein EVAR_99237_1 [Eumeta japonica]
MWTCDNDKGASSSFAGVNDQSRRVLVIHHTSTSSGKTTKWAELMSVRVLLEVNNQQTHRCHTSHVYIVVYVQDHVAELMFVRVLSTGQGSCRLTSYYFIALGFTRCSFLLAGGQQPKQTHRCHTSHVYIVVYSTGEFQAPSLLLARAVPFKAVASSPHHVQYWSGESQIDKLLLHCSWLHALFLLLTGGQQPRQRRPFVIHHTSTSSYMYDNSAAELMFVRVLVRRVAD